MTHTLPDEKDLVVRFGLALFGLAVTIAAWVGWLT